ncbi:nectin-4-like [Cyprinodon tularosa]|uniref:nectin-4-like n=1 Tax=Cyprinodon tularosa TaxID=77115 RepID=UPI0018E257F3|nr:nectin-4-like [Cyprinodon tularosa]
MTDPWVTAKHGESEDDPSKLSLQSLEEKETVLPCLYDQSGVSIVQVTWHKIKSDGTNELIITSHRTDGQTAFGTWDGRVRFKSSQPTVDWTLVIISTKVSDEGDYMCLISTFPTGNFEKKMSVIVWTTPITDLVLHNVKEGDPYKQVASCRSFARPPPRLSWDTELNGRSVNHTSESCQISINYYLHPVRGMNGKKLDCLVWHPAFSEPRRLKSALVVHSVFTEPEICYVPQMCYVLLGILFLYGIILTALYCRVKIHNSREARERKGKSQQTVEEGIYMGLTPHAQDTYETISIKK